jgi:UDP-glucose 4-epimerase
MKKNIAILGATGFIGQAVTRLFLGTKKVNLFLTSKKGGKFNGHTIHPLDLTRENSLAHRLKHTKIDCIIYLSSQIPPSLDASDWNLFDLNCRMHQQVLKCWQLKRCHLIYASSCSVYGKGRSGPLRESMAPLPDNYYSISKLNGEYLFSKEHFGHVCPLTVLRVNAPYGHKEQRKTVINIFIENALRGDPLKLMGTGKREQDFIHVEDVARAIWSAYAKRKYGVYNIASGRSVTMRQLAKTVVRSVGSPSKIVFAQQPDPQEGLRVKIDVGRAKKELGFKPKYDLEKGLLQMAALYRRGGY